MFWAAALRAEIGLDTQTNRNVKLDYQKEKEKKKKTRVNLNRNISGVVKRVFTSNRNEMCLVLTLHLIPAGSLPSLIKAAKWLLTAHVLPGPF